MNAENDFKPILYICIAVSEQKVHFSVNATRTNCCHEVVGEIVLLFGHIVGVMVIQMSARGCVCLRGCLPGGICLGGSLPRGCVCLEECLSGGWYLPRRVSVGGCLAGGGCLPGGVCLPRGDTPLCEQNDRQV